MAQIEFDYYIAPDGAVYNFHDTTGGSRAGRFLMSFAGQGMPETQYVTQRGPFQHGETVLDYRLPPRTITYIHRRNSCDREGYWRIRADILNLLRPNRQAANSFLPGQLRKVMPAGEKRDIDVFIQQGPLFEARNTDVWDEAGFSEALRWYAPDPTFYDPTQVTRNLSGVFCSNLIFPITFPIQFCDTAANTGTDTIAYSGTWLTYPTIQLTGRLKNPIVRNLTTDEKIELAYEIPSGTTITIDLAYGRKTVVDSSGVNRIGVVTTDSDLATFHIAPDPEAPGGVNTLSIVGSNSDASTRVYFSFFTRYIGI